MLDYIWLIISFIFLIFAIYHLVRSEQEVKTITSKAEVKGINGMNLGIYEFIKDFNNYINKLNNDNRKMNLITGYSYIINAFIAFCSYFISKG